MKSPSLKHHGQVSIHRNAAQPRHVALRALLEARTVHPARGQNAVSRELIHDGRGEDNVGKRRLENCLIEVLAVAGLFHVIKLVDEPLAPVVDKPLGVSRVPREGLK